MEKFDGRIGNSIAFMKARPYLISDYGKKCLKLIENSFNNKVEC
ncbi:hypothetical protein [Clostridium sp.]